MQIRSQLKLLWAFVKLLDRRKELELAWQEVQQDKHNADFKDQVFKGNVRDEVAYKTGFVDGIKWSINRFSS